jgi:predicted RNase H-like HicB family nuclease
MILKVLIHSADEGGFWAEVPALPGCVSQGESVEELRSNIREAIEGWLMAEEDKVADSKLVRKSASGRSVAIPQGGMNSISS